MYHDAYYIRLAKEMLEVGVLPEGLEHKLHTANNLLKKVGGGLTSRQTVVTIILMWELEQTLDKFD